MYVSSMYVSSMYVQVAPVSVVQKNLLERQKQTERMMSRCDYLPKPVCAKTCVCQNLCVPKPVCTSAATHCTAAASRTLHTPRDGVRGDGIQTVACAGTTSFVRSCSLQIGLSTTHTNPSNASCSSSPMQRHVHPISTLHVHPISTLHVHPPSAPSMCTLHQHAV